MGKKRIEKIERIENDNSRKVTLCKRKKGVIKKMIELSVLCDLKIFALIHDESSKRTTHFSSHKDFDMFPVFNELNFREFFSNGDYKRVGGIKEELDSQYNLSDSGVLSQAAYSETEEQF